MNAIDSKHGTVNKLRCGNVKKNQIATLVTDSTPAYNPEESSVQEKTPREYLPVMVWEMALIFFFNISNHVRHLLRFLYAVNCTRPKI